MNNAWKVILLILPTLVQGQHSMQVVNYLTSFIQHLSDQALVSFNMWFYISTDSIASTLDAIIASKSMAAIPRQVLHSKGKIEVNHSPTLLVLHFSSSEVNTLEEFLSSDLESPMTVIVLYDHQDLAEAMQLFSRAHLHNVIYVRNDALVLHHKIAFQSEVFCRTGEVFLEDLFVDSTSNLTGITIHCSFSPRSTEVLLTNAKLARKNHIMKVIEDTVRRLGGASQFHEVNSAEFDDVDDYVLKLYMYNASTMYDFGANAITRSDVMNEHFFYSIVPVTMHVAAPTGRPLTAFEVFIAPFQSKLWTSLLMLMLVCTLVMLLFPARFVNDLILLPMCSFQRRTLHRVSLLEKIVFIALIVMYFVLFKAYEAKITAFMTNFPHSRDPRTLDDLFRSNITIEQDEGDFSEDMSDEDPRYRQLFSPVPFRGKYTIHWKSQNLAFVGSRLFMKLAMSDARNFEPETGRPRFTVVDRFTLGERIAFYFCTFRNPLVPKVQRAEMWHYEAGLVDFWVQELIQQEKGNRHLRLARGRVVGLFELKPVFYGITIGWMMAGLVFAMELFCDVIKRSCYNSLERIQTIISILGYT